MKKFCQNLKHKHSWTEKNDSTNKINNFLSISQYVTHSYALLSVLSRLDGNQGSTTIEDAFPILEWLLGQQNSNGGFVSTPDTTVALTALREFSKKMKVFDRDSRIDLRYSYTNAVRSMKIDSAQARNSAYFHSLYFSFLFLDT